MIMRTATARYDGMGKEGKGRLTTESGALEQTPYAFGTRFGDEKGTNPEELIAAAHAGCFTMALAFALAKEARPTEIWKRSRGSSSTRMERVSRFRVRTWS